MMKMEFCSESIEDITFWKRVRYSETLIEKKQRPWITKYVEGRGYTAFATQRYEAGDWIMTEFPVVWVHGHHPFTPEQVEEILEKVDQLSSEDSVAFYAMANVFSESEYPLAVGIFMTNCFDMTDSIYGTTCAMYLALARLNHSCAPNVQQTHLPDTTEEVVYATRTIEIGEEINDCYIDLRYSRHHRQQTLFEHYRFTCACIACNLSDEQILQTDDLLRDEARLYVDKLIALIEQEDQLYQAYDYGLQIIERLEKPPAIYWSIRFLPEGYHLLSQIAQTIAQVSAGEKKKFQKIAGKYLKKSLAITKLLQGPRSPETMQRMKEVEQLMAK